MTRPITRRQVLRGAGGVALALPVLPSLLVGKAHGADPVLARAPRLYWIATNHGGALESAFFPDASPATRSHTLLSDHEVHAGPLRASAEGAESGHSALSRILQAPDTLLTDRRIAQLNVLRGIDVPFGLGHHGGGHMGNYAHNESLGGAAAQGQSEPRPTIDQLLAWSPSFYGELEGVRERVLSMGSLPISFGYSNPSTGTGQVQPVRAAASSLELFRRVFAPADAPEAARVPVVDRVLASYHRLRHGSRRLSVNDRRRLDDHMDRIAELQRKLQAEVPAACGGVETPHDDSVLHEGLQPEDGVRYAQLHNEVNAAAFVCGASRIAVLGLGDAQRFASFSGDWHAEVAHYWLEPDRQQLLQRSYREVFSRVFLDMAARLDHEEADGVSYLDNSLLVWSQESGMSTHDPISMPIVTAGSACGALQTGQSIDYRRAGDPQSSFRPLVDSAEMSLGVLHSQLLANLLQALGMPAAEYERWGHPGYGVPRVEPSGVSVPYADHYGDTSSRYFQIASDPLPFLRSAP